MAKFIPSEQIELLEYDFAEYGGGAGVIHEPSTGDVNRFFKSMKGLMKDVKQLQAAAKNLDKIDSIEEMSDAELAESIGQVDEVESQAAGFQARTLENLAQLCGARWELVEIDEGTEKVQVLVGGAPSYDDLERLPYRVLQAFSSWLMAAIRPKKTTPGSKN